MVVAESGVAESGALRSELLKAELRCEAESCGAFRSCGFLRDLLDLGSERAEPVHAIGLLEVARADWVSSDLNSVGFLLQFC